MNMPRTLIAALFVGLGANAAAAGPAPACDGLPRLDAATAPGFCLGMVADGMKSPRGLALIPNGDIVVADMGGWQPGHGRIWLLRRTAQGYAKTVLFDLLDRPNGAALGPDGNVYVGMAGRVARFTPGDGKPVLVDVIGGASGIAALPATGRHPLPAILFGADGNLIVSVGASTDHCERADGTMAPGAVCADRTGRDAVGTIRQYTMSWPAGKVLRWEVLARGLRNSMAMAVDARTGILWQGENARDGIQAAMPALKNDDELPHDELNAIVAGADYGWPYCYDNGVPSPEYPAASCRDARAPVRLLPAHAAPLGMAFYTARQFPPPYSHSLIVAYHGYRQHGHRVVALLDKTRAGPAGRSVTLVSGARGKARGLGAPVGIGVGADGNVYISDDHGGIVARLHYEGKEPGGRG
jgi:glucose/arabinose dehydrogenase